MEKVSRSEALSIFARLDLPVAFGVDLNELKDRFRRKMLQVHPDQAICLPPWVRQRLEAKAAQLNFAYHALQSSVLRGRLVLCYYGQEIDQYRLDPKILEELFAWQEQWDALKKDASALKLLQQSIQQRYDDCSSNLSSLFQQQDFPAACMAINYLIALKRLMNRV